MFRVQGVYMGLYNSSLFGAQGLGLRGLIGNYSRGVL